MKFKTVFGCFVLFTVVSWVGSGILSFVNPMNAAQKVLFDTMVDIYRGGCGAVVGMLIGWRAGQDAAD